MLFEIIDGISKACGPSFSLGVRLSPERFGVQIDESLDLAARLLQDPRLDYLDMSLWDVFKEPQDPAYHGKSLLMHFAELPRAGVALGAAGKIVNAQDCRAVLDAGLDFVVLGRTAILHSNVPQSIAADPQFAPVKIPVTRDYLAEQGLGEAFINYMSTWKGFVEAS
jgi:2,4-dienoyl-CoA reductase-like NADH-dependent reductase (Old Yellow Enzyme family)